MVWRVLLGLGGLGVVFSYGFCWGCVLLLVSWRKLLVFRGSVFGCVGIILVGSWGNFIGVNFIVALPLIFTLLCQWVFLSCGVV